MGAVVDEVRLEDPEPVEFLGQKGLPTKGVELAAKHPGKWVFVRQYKNTNTASAAGWKLVHRFEGLEHTSRKGKLYVRFQED
jgi:hypothetical protein